MNARSLTRLPGPATLFAALPKVETARMLLRAPRLDDAADCFAYARDPEVPKYMPWEAHRTIEDSRAFLRRTLEENARGVRGTWAITFKGEDRMVGTFAFSEWVPAFRRAAFGYVIGRDHWAQGIMSEVLARMLRFGFETMDLNRIEAVANNDNLASCRVMEKNGMRQEGLLRQHMLIHGGRPRDSRLYAILREEWSAPSGG